MYLCVNIGSQFIGLKVIASQPSCFVFSLSKPTHFRHPTKNLMVPIIIIVRKFYFQAHIVNNMAIEQIFAGYLVFIYIYFVTGNVHQQSRQ